MKEQAKKFNLTLATHLRIKRHEAKLTMRGLSAKLGVPHSFIGKIENEGRRMDVGEFVYYCQTLGCDPVNTLAALIKAPE